LHIEEKTYTGAGKYKGRMRIKEECDIVMSHSSLQTNTISTSGGNRVFS